MLAALPPPTLGKLLLRLLKYFGEELNPSTTGLSVKMGPFPLRAGNPAGTGAGAGLSAGVLDPLTIPDPFDEGNNVGRNCFRFYQVQQVFREARRAIVQFGASGAWPPVSTPAAAAAATAAAGVTGVAVASTAPAPAPSALEESSPSKGGAAGASGAGSGDAAVAPSPSLEPVTRAQQPVLSAALSAALPAEEFPLLSVIISALRAV